MRTRDFDYPLPEEAIAQHPVPRGASRLLVLDARGEARHRRVRDLPRLLSPGDLVVVNDTRVIPARLFARRRPGGGRVEILLVEPAGEPAVWEALVKPGKKARPGSVLELPYEAGEGEEPTLEAEVLGKTGGGRYRVRFSEPVEPHLERLGHVPLPPYIKRPDAAEDRERYQTVFAARPGAIAAPTAGLHFDEALLAGLAERGVAVARLTLHVGIGTFQPVTAERVEEHAMEGERWILPQETAEAVRRTRRERGRVVAVGTTVVRALEAAAQGGGGEGGGGREGGAAGGEVPIVAGSGCTDLFITPGYRFRVIDVLLTNFHLPCSTLLMLVSAFAGRERVLAAYREAIREGYRFYSYGDAMLAERRDRE